MPYSLQYLCKNYQMTGQLYLTYKQLVYILVYDKQRIEIYSADNLQIVESIRNLFVDIRTVINVRDGNFIAITQREAVFYALCTTDRKQLFWKKMATEMIDQNTIAAEFCKSSNELILLSSNLIQCIQCKLRDDLGFIKQSELSLGWAVSVKQELKDMDVSQDEELLALLSEKGRIYIWSLKLIPTVFKKNMNLSELGENSCSFYFDDIVEQLQFKTSIKQTKNCLYALSKDHLRVFQEIRDGPTFSFVNMMNLRLHGLRQFIQINCSLSQKKLVTSNALPYNSMESVDPIILQVGSKFILYQFYGLRGSTMKAEFREIKELQLGFSRITNALYTNSRNLLMIGEENENICQVKLLHDQQHPVKHFTKIFFIKISECYFSQSSNYVVLRLEDGSYCRKNIAFNNWLNSQPVDSSIFQLSIKTSCMGCLHGQIFYFVENQVLHMHNIISNTQTTLACPRQVKFISFLEQLPSGLYFAFDGDIIVLSEGKIETFQRMVPPKQLLKVEVVHTSSSILFKTNRGYWLYQWYIQENTFKTIQIRKSTEHMIYGGGYWTQLRQSEIVFGSKSKALVSFSLDTFLDALSKKHNLRGLKYKLGHLINQIFTLQIQNYFFFLAIILDIKKQRYIVNVLRKNAYSKDYLVIRIPRMAALERTRLVYMNNCFYIWADKQLMIIGRYPQDPVGLDFKDLTQSVGYINASIHRPVPIQNPYFLKELLSMGLFNQVDAILQYIFSLTSEKHINPFLTLPCTTLAKFLNKQLGELKLDIIKLPDDLKNFQQMVIQKPQITELTGALPLLLSDIIDFSRFRLQNQRSLDLCSSVFISRVRRIFSLKQKISTRDVCWALHSIHKEQLFMFLIQQPLERKQEGLSWKIIKKYSVVLWYDDINQVKKWIEKIALSEYRITKDPFECLLWYILLGKKNVLLVLFKKNEENLKTAEFLQRDFTQPNHQTAASKNAYALLSKKRYEHAIAFFILANAFKDAITVCLNQLQDPHLAILICKIFKQQVGSEMIKQIYQKVLLQTGKTVGDPWMMHIAYYLLGQHIESYNCLFEEDCNFDVPTPTSGAPIVCQSWKAQFDPELSLFHPSIISFSNVVRQSLPFKRQLQQRGEQFEPSVSFQNSINNSIDYYIRLNMPELAIAFTIQNLQILSLNAYRKQKLVEGYLNSLMCLVIKSRSVRSSLSIIKQISQLLQMDQSKILATFEKRIQNIDCGELLFDFYIETGNLTKTKEYIYNFKNQLVLFMLHKNISRLETNQPYLMAFHLIFWGEKIIKKCQELSMEVKDLQIYICMLKLIILLRMEINTDLFSYTQQLLDLLANKPVAQITWQESMFQKLIKIIPSRGNRIQTVKTSKKMDILEETFRKAVEEEMISSVAPSQTDLVFMVFRHLFFSVLICRIPPANFLQQIVVAERNRASELLSIFLDSDRIQAILNQYLEVVATGVYAWNKTSLLSSNNHIDKDQVTSVLQLLGAQAFLQEKASAFRLEQLHNAITIHQGASIKQNIFKTGVQVFKNRVQPIKSFILNNFQGAQNECVVLFKRNLRKFDLYHSLLSRPRNPEGSSLTQDDSTFNTNQVSKFMHQNPLVNTCAQILKCNFSKKSYGAIRYQKIIDLHLSSYLKQLDPLPYVNYNQMYSITSHRYLPLFFIGARSGIDVYNFSTMKNFNRITCRDLSQIVKINTNYTSDLIGGVDSDGNFCSMNLDSSYHGGTSLLVKKQNVIDFCYLNSNIVATGSKDGSINVYDPLLHSNRNVIFKQKLVSLSLIDYLPKSDLMIANRRSELCTYDLRRGMLNRMEVGSDITSIATDPMTQYIYAGTINGQIRVFEKQGTELLSLKPFKFLKKPPSISQLRVSKGNLFALSSEGVLSYAYF